jgi:hypothetical protein
MIGTISVLCICKYPVFSIELQCLEVLKHEPKCSFLCRLDMVFNMHLKMVLKALQRCS